MTTLYEVLRRPIETEKSRHQSGKLHQYVFEVDRHATKGQIKEAVQTLFDVEVQKVNVIVLPAKRGRRGKTGRRIGDPRPGIQEGHRDRAGRPDHRLI